METLPFIWCPNPSIAEYVPTPLAKINPKSLKEILFCYVFVFDLSPNAR